MKEEREEYRNYGNKTDAQIREEAYWTAQNAVDFLNNSEEYINGFFDTGRKNQSNIRLGLFFLARGIELATKSIIQYYGESYVIHHAVTKNGNILGNLKAPEVYRNLYEEIEILTNSTFQYNLGKYATTAIYENVRFENKWLKQAQRIRGPLRSFLQSYILDKEI